MELIEKFKHHVTHNTEVTDYCLYTIRFRKLLEKTWVLMNLMADGREKMSGEYILDFHYITALIESIEDNLGQMVFNASVLAPEGGELLYDEYDRCREKARQMILSANGISMKQSAAINRQPSVEEEPEYRLLKRVLNWFDEETADGSTVRTFIKQIFNHVMSGPHALPSQMGEGPDMVIASDETIHHIHRLNIFEKISRNRKLSNEQVQCRPLQMMELGARTDLSDIPKNQHIRTCHWTATVDENHLSLCMLMGPEVILRIEASLNGHLNSDYIFICSKNQVNTQDIIPQGFHIEQTGYVQLAWIYDVPIQKIEESLVLLGRNLFCNHYELF